MNQETNEKQTLEIIINATTGKRFAFVVDQVIVEYYPTLIEQLNGNERCVGYLSIEALESQKSLPILNNLLEDLLNLELHRDDILIAIGGGIVTDMVGLASHLLKRGMQWLAVPTTLLGMIDAAIGGKTAVDMPQGKNLVGAFHPPQQVLVLPNFLQTLPEREWVNGIGEAVKYGFLARPDFLNRLYGGESVKSLVLEYLDDFKGLKEAIVAQDPDETHVRMQLNLGHTLGHCLEKHFDYERFAHGEAVLYGLYWSLLLSTLVTELQESCLNDYEHWLTAQPWFDCEVLQHPEWFISGLAQDKKIRQGRLNFVLLERIGQPVIKSIGIKALENMLCHNSIMQIDNQANVPIHDKVIFFPQSFSGQLSVPPSKSDSHRAIIAGGLAALSGQSSGRVNGLVYSQDVTATLMAMAAFGLNYTQTQDSVIFMESKFMTPSDPIDCNESGSTLRFCIPLSQLVDGPVTYTGQNHLRHRPLTDYQDLFLQKEIDYNYNGELPITVSRGNLTGEMSLKGNVSSQYFSGLFFTLPLSSNDSEISVIGDLESKGYVDMTLDTLLRHGIKIENQDYKKFLIPGNQQFRSCVYSVEGDYSNAAFWIVAGQIQGPVHLSGLKKESLQRDKEVIDVVLSMGGLIHWEGDILISSPSKTHGTVIDAREIPDSIPILCVLAALSEGETRVINGERLRVKESDRIKSTVSELKKLGAHIEETADGMVIQGKSSLSGGFVDAWNDHRIAMAMAIAASRCEGPVALTGAPAVKKSYPHFYSDYQKMGGKVYALDTSHLL